MRREIIIAFARALGGTKRCQQWTEAEWDWENWSFLFFWNLLLSWISQSPPSISSRDWVWFGKLIFCLFLEFSPFREPQTFIRLLTDLSDCLLFFIALSSFLRVQVWQHRQLLNRLLTDFFSSPASLSPEFKFNILIEPQSLLTGFFSFCLSLSSEFKFNFVVSVDSLISFSWHLPLSSEF